MYQASQMDSDFFSHILTNLKHFFSCFWDIWYPTTNVQNYPKLPNLTFTLWRLELPFLLCILKHFQALEIFEIFFEKSRWNIWRIRDWTEAQMQWKVSKGRQCVYYNFTSLFWLVMHKMHKWNYTVVTGM